MSAERKVDAPHNTNLGEYEIKKMEYATPALIVSLLTLIFNVGLYFGVIREKMKILDNIDKEFYAHISDENKHFSQRDWKHLNDTLEEMKKSLEAMRQELKRH